MTDSDSVSASRPGEPVPEPTSSDPLSGRLALRLDDLATALSVSRRSIERERSAGRFPLPDRVVGKMPLWSPETIRQWMAGGRHR
jgi:hypothetical protein